MKLEKWVAAHRYTFMFILMVVVLAAIRVLKFATTVQPAVQASPSIKEQIATIMELPYFGTYLGVAFAVGVLMMTVSLLQFLNRRKRGEIRGYGYFPFNPMNMLGMIVFFVASSLALFISFHHNVAALLQPREPSAQEIALDKLFAHQEVDWISVSFIFTEETFTDSNIKNWCVRHDIPSEEWSNRVREFRSLLFKAKIRLPLPDQSEGELAESSKPE